MHRETTQDDTLNMETQSTQETAESGALRSSDWFSSVYDVLVTLGGANETMRDRFVYNHTDEKSPCTEWRFCGHLGYGGKYRSERNRVDCYREDETPARAKIITEVNAALSALENIPVSRADTNT